MKYLKESIKRFSRRVMPRNYRRLLRHAYQDPKHMWSYLRRFVLGECLVVVVATPHKVGSTWLYKMLLDVGDTDDGMRQVPRTFHEIGALLLQPGVFPCLRRLHGYVIFKSHSFPPSPKTARGIKLVTMYRDPRDVVVSSAFYPGFPR